MFSLTAEEAYGRPVAVLGGGVLGRRIGCVWAAAGFNVRIRDPSEKQRFGAMEYIEHNLSIYCKATGKKPGSFEAFADFEPAVKDAWHVCEAVPEMLDLKLSTFLDLEKHAPQDCLLSTNSSSYKSSELDGKVQPETRKRIFNTHYMMPPETRIVELMTDGDTYPEVFPFMVDRLKEAAMHPVVARKQSTGFVFNRLWAAIKREVMMILSEGVSVPSEIDAMWLDMYSGGKLGPCAMMDNIGLDTVAFIEEHYIKERNLSSVPTVDYLKREYLSQGKLGKKSNKGGFYPPGRTLEDGVPISAQAHEMHQPTLYFLDLGLGVLEDPMHSGRILSGSADGRPLRTILSGEACPDGVDISLDAGRMYWTNMGVPSSNDGCVRSAKLDGSDVKTIVPEGTVHTPKQLVIEHDSQKLYFCDREGLRVWRCNLDGTDLENIMKTGDFHNDAEKNDPLLWPVGIAVDAKDGKFYWTQKGPSKGNKGRIFRANVDMPSGEAATNRSDIECVLGHLPECIDLEFDADSRTLTWTDRGDPPIGNSINRVEVDKLTERKQQSPKLPYDIVARNMHEAIGLKLDKQNKHIYATDLGGCVYRFDWDGKNKKKFYEDEGGVFSGITLLNL